MKKLIVVGSCLLLFCAGWVFGQNKVLILNGTNWKVFPDSQRIMYVYGFQQGYHQGVPDGMGLDSRWTIKLLAKTHCNCTPMPTQLSEAEIVTEMNAEAEDKKYPFYGHSETTLNQFVETMSIFYNDYRNTPVCWDKALRFSAASLAGRAPTEEELDAARKADAESGCK